MHLSSFSIIPEIDIDHIINRSLLRFRTEGVNSTEGVIDSLANFFRRDTDPSFQSVGPVIGWRMTQY